MNTFVLLTIFALSQVHSLEVASVSSVQRGEFRSFNAVASPSFLNPYGFAVTGVKFKGSAANGTATGALDAAKFAFGTPGLAGEDRVSFYFGVLSASGTIDTSAKAASVAGAFAEIVAAFDQVFVWYNYDNSPGFQYTLGDEWECPSGTNPAKDCLEPTLSIKLSTLTWTTITFANQSCPAGAGYQSTCKVYHFSTSGSLGADKVITFTFYLASEPVLVNNVQVGPDYAKVDIEISYPWTQKPSSRASPRVGLLSYGAGKAGSAVYAGSSSSSSFSWVGAGGYNAAFSWSQQAQINNGAMAPVYVSGFSSQDLKAYNCPAGGSVSLCLRITGLKAAAGIYEALGWSTRVVWFSWDAVQPTTVFWDPAVGSSGSDASSLSVSLLSVLAFVLLALK